MKKTLFCLLFSFFITFTFKLYAQNESDREVYLFKGNIVNNENNEPVPLVTVYNKTRQKGITSDVSGKFLINYQYGDSIIFQSLGFENYVYLTNEATSNELHVIIAMQPKTYELKSVDIMAFRTAEDFKKHILSMDMPLEQKLEIPGLDIVKQENFGEGKMVISGPVSFLYNNFSRRAKDYRKFLSIKSNYETQQAISSKYKEVVKKIVTMDDDEQLEEFMAFCKLHDSFIENANEYDLIVAVNKCYDEFKLSKN